VKLELFAPTERYRLGAPPCTHDLQAFTDVTLPQAVQLLGIRSDPSLGSWDLGLRAPGAKYKACEFDIYWLVVLTILKNISQWGG